MKTIIRFILLTAIRDKLFPALLVLIIALIGINSALSETAMLEEHQMQVAMSAGLGRIVLNLGVMIFVCFHVRAMYDNKEIDVMLSRPLSRTSLLIGLWSGFALVATILTLAIIGIIALLQPASMAGLGLWGVSLLLECWLAVAIALFASITAKSAVTSVLVSMTLYVLGRVMAFFVATANARISFETPYIGDILQWMVKSIAMVIPRLDMFAHAEWLNYGIGDGDVFFFLAQAAIYIPFLICVAMIDFRRKQF